MRVLDIFPDFSKLDGIILMFVTVLITLLGKLNPSPNIVVKILGIPPRRRAGSLKKIVLKTIDSGFAAQ